MNTIVPAAIFSPNIYAHPEKSALEQEKFHIKWLSHCPFGSMGMLWDCWMDGLIAPSTVGKLNMEHEAAWGTVNSNHVRVAHGVDPTSANPHWFAMVGEDVNQRAERVANVLPPLNQGPGKLAEFAWANWWDTDAKRKAAPLAWMSLMVAHTSQHPDSMINAVDLCVSLRTPKFIGNFTFWEQQAAVLDHALIFPAWKNILFEGAFLNFDPKIRQKLLAVKKDGGVQSNVTIPKELVEQLMPRSGFTLAQACVATDNLVLMHVLDQHGYDWGRKDQPSLLLWATEKTLPFLIERIPRLEEHLNTILSNPVAERARVGFINKFKREPDLDHPMPKNPTLGEFLRMHASPARMLILDRAVLDEVVAEQKALKKSEIVRKM